MQVPLQGKFLGYVEQGYFVHLEFQTGHQNDGESHRLATYLDHNVGEYSDVVKEGSSNFVQPIVGNLDGIFVESVAQDDESQGDSHEYGVHCHAGGEEDPARKE